jgi:ribonuclease BN (tRNA processing enzyme)
MRLTVLGASGTYPRPGGACNGLLLRNDNFNMVLDFGNGCMSNLLKYVDFTALDAVIISHLHIDHFADLYPLFYALRFHPDHPWGLSLWQPAGGLALLGAVLGEETRQYLPRVFEFGEIAAGLTVELGGMRLRFFPAVHNVEAYSVRIEGDGWCLAYSGDTAAHPGLVEAARGADLFICEATMPRGYEKEAALGHLTSRQAGEAARQAGVGELMLTHIWPTFDRELIKREAQEAFGGRVSLAHEDLQVEMGERG